MIILNQNMETEQNYVRWTLIALSFILKLKIFMKALQIMLKDDLTHLTMMKIKPLKDHLQ